MLSLTRQNVLIVLSVVTIAGGTMFGAGAFSQVQADRTVDVATAGDSNAYLQLTSDSPYVTSNNGSNSNEIGITLDRVNENSTIEVNEAFNVTVDSEATGSNYGIYIDDSNAAIGSDAELEFERVGSGSITGQSTTETVSPGTTMQVSITVDLRSEDHDVTSIPDTITIVANEQ